MRDKGFASQTPTRTPKFAPPVTDAEQPTMDLGDGDEHLYACRSTEEIEALTVLCPSMASLMTRKHTLGDRLNVVCTHRSIPSWTTCSDYFGSSS